MEYRKMKKNGNDVSLLGFGCMRFPLNAAGKINTARAQKMIDIAYKAGVNYFDTAYPYHNGESEIFVGKALKKYERSSFFLTTKLPCFIIDSLEQAKEIFEEQVNRLQVDYLDFYLMHSLDRASYDKMKELGIVDWMSQLKKEGRIHHYGFSFHDDYEAFSYILKDQDWDICQIQLNYMDTEFQAGMKGYKLAEKMGIPLVVMEPVRGGSLAGFSEELEEPFKACNKRASMASYALRWVGSFSHVNVILSGMSDLDQVRDNIESFSPFVPLNPKEQIAVLKVSNELKKKTNVMCTGCAYCMPCPKGVNIPENFTVWNDYGIYENVANSRWAWTQGIGESEKAKNCVSCGLCENACPQELPIRSLLKRVQTEMDELIKSDRETCEKDQ